MTASPSTASAVPASRLALARAAISTEFLILGAGSGVWAVHIPIVQKRLDIDPGTIGLAFLCFALGATLTMPLTGAAIARWGSRVPTMLFGLAHPILLIAIVLSGSIPMLFVCMFLEGAASGGLDVSMNTQAAEYERAQRRPLMSSFHAFFSIGALAGSAAAGGLIALGLAHGGGGVVVAVVLIALGIAASFHLWAGETQSTGDDQRPRFSLPPPVLIALGIVTFLAFAAEGAVSDWSALYLATDKGWSVAAAAWGFIAFSIVMSVARLTGDWIVARLGPVRTLALGGIVTAAGFVIVVAAPWPVAVATGFAIVALGIANMAPVTFSASASTPGVPPGVGVAAVTTLGYGGFIVFPPFLGFIAKSYGFAAAFSIVIVMALIITVMARVVRR